MSCPARAVFGPGLAVAGDRAVDDAGVLLAQRARSRSRACRGRPGRKLSSTTSYSRARRRKRLAAAPRTSGRCGSSACRGSAPGRAPSGCRAPAARRRRSRAAPSARSRPSPVSSTLTTSAPRSASRSEQKPPGRSRVRSRTRTSLSGSAQLRSDPALAHWARASRGASATVAARRPDVLGHLARLRDQVAVGARHLAVRAGRGCPRARRGRCRRATSAAPISLHWSREIPITCQLLGPSGPPGICSAMKADVAGVGPDAAVDADHQRDVERLLEQPHVDQRVEVGDVAGVEALVLGLDPELAHRGEELDDRVEAVLEHRLEDEVLAPLRVLRVVHRAHVQRRDVRPQLAQVLDPLLDRDPDRAGRVVDDHVVDLGQDRLGDRAEVLDLVDWACRRGCGRGCGSARRPRRPPAAPRPRTPPACRGSPGTGRGWRSRPRSSS